MNDLSIWLYMIDLASSLRVFLVIFAAIATIGVAFAGLFIPDSLDLVKESLGLSFIKKFIIVYIISIIVLIALPTEKTMHMMLASELGEAAYKSEEGQLIKDKVIAILDKYLEEEKK